MKDKYLIAFDMDGTLLNSKKKISFLTLHYLKKLAKQGHKIVLASGRPSRSLYKYYYQLKLDTPMICYNGAYTFSPLDKNFTAQEFQFPQETVKQLVRDLKPYIKNVMCETDKEIWVDKEDKYLDKFFWYKDMDVHFGDIAEILSQNPMTMIVQTNEELKDSSIIDDVVAKYPGLAARFWTGSPYFELFFVKTSKGASIDKIAAYYHIPKERIIVFGDAENDVEMFQGAGIAVAMSNGKKALKEHATYISLKDNDHNGIYYTLKAILKGKI